MKNFELLRNRIPALVQHESLSWCQQRSSFNILSVGGGTGEIDMEIMKIIKKELQKSDQARHVKIFNRAVEPNEYSCGLYRAAIENLPSPVNDDLTEFEICQQTFQEYKERHQRQEAGSVKFDMVHFIHTYQEMAHCSESNSCSQVQTNAFCCLLRLGNCPEIFKSSQNCRRVKLAALGERSLESCTLSCC